MIKRLGIVSIIMMFLSLKCLMTVQAQELSVYASEESLESVLIRIAPSISFDSHLVSPYRVTLRKDFKDVEEALEYLLRKTPLKFKKAGEVYVVYRPRTKQKQARDITLKKTLPTYYYQGKVCDFEEHTPMQYAIVHGKKLYVSCDEDGLFSFTSSEPEIEVTLQFVGYQPLDTVLVHGKHALTLRLADNSLQEVVVESNAVSLAMQYSDYQDHTLLHRNMMLDLPGTVDNSSWQTLRLMPGIRASGEPLNDPIIWGSTGDESAIYLDGMRLFLPNSMSKQIGVVSPMVIDHISVQKVNHDMSLGNHTGGIVEVKSRVPSKKIRVEGQVSNNLASAYISLPLGNRWAFSLASRRSFSDMFSDFHLRQSQNANKFSQFNWGNGGNNRSGEGNGLNGTGNGRVGTSTVRTETSQENRPNNGGVSFLVHPDYDYFDLQAGVTGRWGSRNQHRLKMHFYTNDEDLNYTITRAVRDENTFGEGERTMGQYSGAVDYSYQWSSGHTTSLLSTYSEAENTLSLLAVIPQEVSVSECRSVLQHNMHYGNHKLTVDAGWTQYKTSYLRQKEDEQVYSVGGRYRWQVGKWFVQGDAHVQHYDAKTYLSPQLYLSYQLHPKWKLQVSAARYYQFLYGVDEDRKQANEWIRLWHLDQAVASTQATVHALYMSDCFLMGQRLIYQKHENTRFFNSYESIDASGEVWGGETYAKLQFPNAYITTNYSLLDVPISSQLWHEWKSAATWHLGDFTLSSQYIYGSGFELTGYYHRFDGGLNYNLSLGSVDCTFGASVLNVFDSENIQSQAYTLQMTAQTPSVMLTEATKRTWLLSAKISF